VVQVSPLPLQVFFYFFLGGAFSSFAGFAAGLPVWGFGLPHPHLLHMFMFMTSLPVLYQNYINRVAVLAIGLPGNTQ
jgi:hypothetical protein